MKLRMCLKIIYGHLKIFKFIFLAFSCNLFSPPLSAWFFLNFNKEKLPQPRQVMIISEIIVKMREKLHVLKNSLDCIGVIDIVPLCTEALYRPQKAANILLNYYCSQPYSQYHVRHYTIWMQFKYWMVLWR